MAKILTDTKIKNLKPQEKPYIESDGQGLQLLIKQQCQTKCKNSP